MESDEVITGYIKKAEVSEIFTDLLDAAQTGINVAMASYQLSLLFPLELALALSVKRYTFPNDYP